MKELHEGQKRKNTGVPYYTHPLRILELMEESPFFFSDDDKCAALLHDIKEDSPGFSWDDLVKRYGRNVAGTVAMLSKSKIGETNPDVYFTMLSLAHPRVLAIKLFDRLHNTMDFNIASSPEWLEKYAYETIELVCPLIQIMVARGKGISGGFYDLGVWIEERLQRNIHGMLTRAADIRAHRTDA